MLDKFNENLIDTNDHLLLAVSGGIDSMVMLHYLHTYSKEQNITLSVVHLDHQKRHESFLDCQFVIDTCKKLSIPCYTDTLDRNNSENFHDYARSVRYDFFVETANKIKANKIVLAHNSNDNAETILMRLTRGSSFEGYRGILSETSYKNIPIIRPLINVSRSEIVEYQLYHHIDFKEDSSNHEDHYTRNRYRHTVLPFLEQENPKYLEKFEQFSEYQTNAYHLIKHLSDAFIREHLTLEGNIASIEVHPFIQLEEILKTEVVKHVVNLQTNNTVELTYQNMKDIIQLFSNEKPHLEMHLDENLHIYKSYNTVSFTKKLEEYSDYEFVINECKEIILPNNALVIITKNPNKYYGIMYKLCYNNLDLLFPLTVRNRRNGDKLLSTSGTKKVKDVFINKKIPINTRNNVPILVNNMNEIIWIPNVFKMKTEGSEELYIIYQEGQ